MVYFVLQSFGFLVKSSPVLNNVISVGGFLPRLLGNFLDGLIIKYRNRFAAAFKDVCMCIVSGIYSFDGFPSKQRSF